MRRRTDARPFRRLAAPAGLALLSYAPLVLSGAGQLNADTKSYLYIDPGRLMARALSVWDPGVGMGTVTHQTIGYLWPMGPFFWLADASGIPYWLAQRIWLGSILFAAGTGVLFLLRRIGLTGGGAFAAATLYMLSPYSIAFASRVSALLLPWAALPWLAGLVLLALRRGGWRHPAAFALITTTVGSINATSLLFAVVGAFLWVPYTVWGTREVPLRTAAGMTGRTALLTLGCNLWWAVALVIGGAFGVPILRATETLDAVSRGSTAPEVLRSLGNWFFYGSDRLGPWVQASVPYTQHLGLIALSFALPVLALAAAAFVRWRARGYFVALLVVGAVIAVGAYPYDAPSAYGATIKTLAGSSTMGMALRNMTRATPMVVLAMACFLGLAVHAVAAGRSGVRVVVTAGVVVLAVLNLPVLWQRSIVDPNLSRAENLPDYWREAAAYLDGRGEGTRVLEVPGSDFAAYRWGNTVDPITPGLIDRPWVARESLPVGSLGSVNLLTAVDRRMQEGVWEPGALGPLARVMGVGDVVVRSDLEFERYRTPRPRAFWQRFSPVPAGFEAPETFGEPVVNRPDRRFPLLDEIELALPPGTPHPPPVAVFPVSEPQPIVRALPSARPVVVAGDGEGLVDLAAAGLLPHDRAVMYAASLAAGEIAAALDHDAELVLTDSNRRRAQRWTVVRENYGYTEQPREEPVVLDPSDGRFEMFPAEHEATQTVADHAGVNAVRATSYGNVVSYTPEDRPVLALDGDLRTAWRAGGFDIGIGERLLVELDEPVETDRLRVAQPQLGARNRWITHARLVFDGAHAIEVTLDAASRTARGQVVTFPPQRFSRLEFEIAGTNVGRRPNYDGLSPVGLAELAIPGVAVEELVRLPTRLLDLAGARSADHPLSVVLSRARSNPAEPVRLDEERALRRVFALPTPRHFDLAGTARLSAERDDAGLDEVLGRPGAPVRGQSNGRLPGDVASRASKALDDDPTTWWQPGLLEQEGHAVEVQFAEQRVLDGLDLVLVADGRHSVPTRLLVEGDGGERREVEVPAVVPGQADGATVPAPISFEPLATRTLKVEVAAVDAVTTRDYFTGVPAALPVGIAELGVGAPHAAPLPDRLPDVCRDDVLTVDGRPVSVRISGATDAAEERRGLALELCGPDAGGLALDAGEHVVRAVPGHTSGVDLDRLVLRSVPDGWAASPEPAPPAVEVEERSRSRLTVEITGGNESSFWLVLGQSHSEGWRARVDGQDLGRPALVNGFANGWLIDPAEQAGVVTVTLEWTPQRWVWLALVTSLIAGLVCVAVVIATWRTRAAPPSVLAPETGPKEPRFRCQNVRGSRSARQTLGIAVVVGLFAVAVSTPAAAAVAALATGAAASWVRARVVVRLLPAMFLALAGAYTAVQQWRYDYPPGFEWPTHFSRVHPFAWVAVAILVGVVLVDRPARHRARGEAG